MKTIPNACPAYPHPYKEIDFAYPSSPTACRLGEAKHGCHVVITEKHEIGPFPSWADADRYALTLPQPFSRWSSPGPEVHNVPIYDPQDERPNS